MRTHTTGTEPETSLVKIISQAPGDHSIFTGRGAARPSPPHARLHRACPPPPIPDEPPASPLPRPPPATPPKRDAGLHWTEHATFIFTSAIPADRESTAILLLRDCGHRVYPCGYPPSGRAWWPAGSLAPHIARNSSLSPLTVTAASVAWSPDPGPASDPGQAHRPAEPSMASRSRSACPLWRAYSSTRCCHIHRTEVVFSRNVNVSSSFAPSSAASTARHSAR